MGVWWSNTAGTARRCFEEFAEIGVYENEVVDLGWGQLRRGGEAGDAVVEAEGNRGHSDDGGRGGSG